MNRIRSILLHIGVICSLICITAKILDWYNPYMDFTGHIWWLQIALYCSVIVLGFTRKQIPPKDNTRLDDHLIRTNGIGVIYHKGTC